MRPRQPSGMLLVGHRTRGFRTTRPVSDSAQRYRDSREYGYDVLPESSSGYHRRPGHRHGSMDDNPTKLTSSRSSREQYRRQYDSVDVASSNRQLDILLDDLIDNKKQRRTKRAAFRQPHHGELFMFVRVFFSVILLSAMSVAVLFCVLYRLSSYASWLSLGSLGGNNEVLLGPDFVQNAEEIRDVLESAREESKRASTDNTQTEEYEKIPHPGNPNMHISVPQFYASISVDNGDLPSTNKMLREFTYGKLLTPGLVSMIGSSASEEETDQYQRTIFVSLLSDGDSHCPNTVANILNTASNPERIRIAVVDKTDSESPYYIPCDEPTQPCDMYPDQIVCKLSANIAVYELKPDMDAGTMFRRHVLNRMVSSIMLRINCLNVMIVNILW
jgi:hypothetical protein